MAPVHWRHSRAKRSVASNAQPHPTMPPYRQQDEGYLRSSEVPWLFCPSYYVKRRDSVMLRYTLPCAWRACQVIWHP